MIGKKSFWGAALTPETNFGLIQNLNNACYCYAGS